MYKGVNLSHSTQNRPKLDLRSPRATPLRRTDPFRQTHDRTQTHARRATPHHTNTGPHTRQRAQTSTKQPRRRQGHESTKQELRALHVQRARESLRKLTPNPSMLPTTPPSLCPRQANQAAPIICLSWPAHRPAITLSRRRPLHSHVVLRDGADPPRAPPLRRGRARSGWRRVR